MADELKIQKKGKKFEVVDSKGTVLETGFPSEAAATEALKYYEEHPEQAHDEEDIEESDEDTNAEEEEDEEPITEHNPHGLPIHQRFAQLLRTLSRAGIKHAETASPAQNANTTNDKFARKPKDGQNKLSTDEKLAAPKTTTE